MVVVVALLVPLAAAAVLLTRLFVRQDRLVFRPGPVLDRDPGSVGIAHEELALPAGDGASVTAWWVAGAAGAPAVLYFHGSEGNLTHELPVVEFLHALGVNALLAEYAGYRPFEPRPNEAGCYRSAAAAWAHVVAERRFPEESVIAFGHSLGASVAAHAAAGRPCGGLVLHSGFTSVKDLAVRAYPFLPVGPFLRTRLDTLAALRRMRCPVLVVHSLDDEHVPFELGRRLYEAVPTTKKLVTVRGSHFGHGWRRAPQVTAAWRELIARDFATWTAP